MKILWEQHGIHPADNLPIYACSGLVAQWEDGVRLHYFRDDFANAEASNPPWSALQEVRFWVAELKRILTAEFRIHNVDTKEDITDKYPDAIVAYGWKENLLQVAVIRTTLEEGFDPPEWFTDGKVPERPSLTLVPADEQVMLTSGPDSRLWRIHTPGPLNGNLLWAKEGIREVTALRGGLGITPDDVMIGRAIAVTQSIDRVRDEAGLFRYAPDGFAPKVLIVRNVGGTMSPELVWIGESLTFKSEFPAV